MSQNLKVVDNKVISYTTHVATIKGDKLLVHGHWSRTTSGHINKIAREYGLTKVDAPLDAGRSNLEMTGLAMLMGEVLAGDSLKEKNDWKMRMLKAGTPEGALHLPEDWDQLPEEEKERRLKGAEEIYLEKH